MIGQGLVDLAVPRHTLMRVSHGDPVTRAFGDGRALPRARGPHHDHGQLCVVLLLVPPLRVLPMVLAAEVTREFPQRNHDVG